MEKLRKRALAAVTDDDQRGKTEQFYRGRNYDRWRTLFSLSSCEVGGLGSPPSPSPLRLAAQRPTPYSRSIASVDKTQ